MQDVLPPWENQLHSRQHILIAWEMDALFSCFSTYSNVFSAAAIAVQLQLLNHDNTEWMNESMNEWINQSMNQSINNVLRPQIYTVRLYRTGVSWDNEMNFGINHAPGAGSIARLTDLQSSALPLCYGYSQIISWRINTTSTVLTIQTLLLWYM